MARRKSTTATTSSNTETAASEASVGAGQTETQEASETETQTDGEALSDEGKKTGTTEAQAAADEAKAGVDGVTVVWAKMAGKSVKGAGGVLITFDDEGKAQVATAEAQRLSKIRGVVIQGA